MCAQRFRSIAPRIKKLPDNREFKSVKEASCGRQMTVLVFLDRGCQELVILIVGRASGQSLIV
jgi:hypothetical protein